jgi:hypothetical protein
MMILDAVLEMSTVLNFGYVLTLDKSMMAMVDSLC